MAVGVSSHLGSSLSFLLCNLQLTYSSCTSSLPYPRILVSMDDSNSDDKKKKSGSLELTDVAREVVSILKDRKNVVNGEDITKTLDQKKLRDKVMNELDVSDSDRGEAKELFEEALKKLENKDEIKFDEDGDVK